MGNILRLLARDADGCCSLPKTGDLFVDFESAHPCDADAQLYDEAEVILELSQIMLSQLHDYRGAYKEIKEAIGSSTTEAETAAWEAVVPLVGKLRNFYEFSQQLNVIIPKILLVLCSPTPDSVGNNARNCIFEQMEEHQALVKEFAKFLDFALKFDECKMKTPAVQNDLSYYRRTVQRRLKTEASMSQANSDDSSSNMIPADVANGMSLFFAHATPMLNALSTITSQFVARQESQVAANTTQMLSVMAKVCQKILDNAEFRSRLKYEDTEQFILRVMVAAIIIYDHVDKTGAFARGSCVDVKGCVKVLKDQDPAEVESLMNALRYTTKHLNNENTPKHIKSMIFENVS